MERSVISRFETLINSALAQLADVRSETSSFRHSGSTKRSLDAALLSRAGTDYGLEVVSLSQDAQMMTDGHRLVGFHQNMPSTLTLLDRLITNDKDLTKRVLRGEGLPVARGAVVTKLDDALALLRSIDGPVVVKPIIGSNGYGITVGVQNESRFTAAVTDALSRKSRILIEECLPSIDLRVTVIGGRAAAAMMRVPANVVGDGSATVAELIAKKNSLRRLNAFHRFVPIKVASATEEHLEEIGLRLDSIPERGRRVFLHYKANLSSGGDSINITDRIHTGFLRLAERAMKCFGSVNHAGVDILAERLDEPPEDQPCVVCEINCNNDLPIHVFPLFGPSIDVATKEIAAYFPDAPPMRRHRWSFATRRTPGLISPDERAQLRRGRGVEREQARYADLAGWSDLPAAIGEPSHYDHPEVSDPPRGLDTQYLLRRLSEQGWDNVYTSGRLLISRRDDRDTIIERSGRSVFSGMVSDRSDVLYQLLTRAGISACVAERFKPGELAKATALVRRSPGPWTLVLPAKRQRGEGTRIAVRNADALKKHWPEPAAKGGPLIVKQAADTLAIGLLFVDGQVVACNLLLPTSVVGDGRSTVAQLMEHKVSLRKRHPSLGLHPIRQNVLEGMNLTDLGLSPSAVVPAGEWIRLGRSPQAKAGGESVGLGTCPVPGLTGMARVALRLLGMPPVASVTMAARPPSRTITLRHWAVSEVDPDPLIAEFAWPWAGEAPGESLYAAVAHVVGAGQRYELARDTVGRS
jgi:D-alanine-D-alanine ligase-like ATP-grasp enzyme